MLTGGLSDWSCPGGWQVLSFEKVLKDAGMGVDQLVWVKTDAVASNNKTSVASSHECLLVAYSESHLNKRPQWQQHFKNFPRFTTSLEKGCFTYRDRVSKPLKVRYNRW